MSDGVAEKEIELSLVLATFNNAACLERLLECLTTCKQPDNWELILVDNGSTDNTEITAMKYADKLPVQYVFERKKGKSSALNRGLRHANGEVVLFTDDDIIPEHNWMMNHLNIMRSNPEINILGGRIHVDTARLPVWLSRSYNLAGILVSAHDLGEIKSIYGPGIYPYGPNMSVRRLAVQGIERPWPEYMGPGTSLPVGDEMVFVNRVSSSEHDRLYSPTCVVEHRVTLPRNYYIKALRRCFQGGYAAGYYSKPETAVGSGQGLFKTAHMRIRTCRSLREFFCIVSRAIGFFTGKILRRAH